MNFDFKSLVEKAGPEISGQLLDLFAKRASSQGTPAVQDTALLDRVSSFLSLSDKLTGLNLNQISLSLSLNDLSGETAFAISHTGEVRNAAAATIQSGAWWNPELGTFNTQDATTTQNVATDYEDTPSLAHAKRYDHIWGWMTNQSVAKSTYTLIVSPDGGAGITAFASELAAAQYGKTLGQWYQTGTNGTQRFHFTGPIYVPKGYGLTLDIRQYTLLTSTGGYAQFGFAAQGVLDYAGSPLPQRIQFQDSQS